MRHKPTILFVLLLTPTLVFAQEGTLQTLVDGLIGFLINIIIPFLLAIGFLFFVVNAIRYFVIETDDVSKRENAKNLALYGVLAFVLILIFWGAVNLLVGFFGLGNTTQTCIPVPDYIVSSGAICTGGPNLSGDITSGPSFSGALQNPPSVSDTSPSIPEPGDTIDTPSLPGSPSTPSTPSAPDAPTTPESPPPADDMREEIDLQAAERPIEALAAEYLATTQLETTFGTYGNLIRDSELLDTRAAGNDDERLQAAYRLQRLGVISDTQYNEYRDAINAYRSSRNLNPISYQYPDLSSSPLPDQIASQVASTQNSIETALNDARGVNTLNPAARASAEAATQADLQSIYDPNNSAAERSDAVDELFFGPNSILDINTHGAILDDFADQTVLFETLFE